MVSNDCSVDDDITARIAKASQAFGRLVDRLWNIRDVHFSTKMSVNKAVVLTVLLYNRETWTLYQRHVKQLDAFHMHYLRRIAGVKWQDQVPNMEVLERCSIRGIVDYIMEAHLRWVGHVIRMGDA